VPHSIADLAFRSNRQRRQNEARVCNAKSWSHCITLEDVANAVELMGYYLGEALRLSQAATLSSELERAEKLRRWITDTWPHAEITPRDVQKNGPITALRQAPKVRSAIATLEKYGWLSPLPPGEIIRGAARREAWRVVRK
jgi:hypothetical protein